MRTSHLALVVTLSLAACSNKVGGEITVNGEKVELSSCRNGVIYGFRGVEVTAKTGLKLRIVATATDEAFVAVIPPGAETGTEIGRCGSLKISDQNSTINDVKNVEGRAKLECNSDGFDIKGTVSFANCH
jgi:hypothetical protein